MLDFPPPPLRLLHKRIVVVVVGRGRRGVSESSDPVEVSGWFWWGWNLGRDPVLMEVESKVWGWCCDGDGVCM